MSENKPNKVSSNIKSFLAGIGISVAFFIAFKDELLKPAESQQQNSFFSVRIEKNESMVIKAGTYQYNCGLLRLMGTDTFLPTGEMDVFQVSPQDDLGGFLQMRATHIRVGTTDGNGRPTASEKIGPDTPENAVALARLLAERGDLICGYFQNGMNLASPVDRNLPKPPVQPRAKTPSSAPDVRL